MQFLVYGLTHLIELGGVFNANRIKPTLNRLLQSDLRALLLFGHQVQSRCHFFCRSFWCSLIVPNVSAMLAPSCRKLPVISSRNSLAAVDCFVDASSSLTSIDCLSVSPFRLASSPILAIT